MITKTLKTDIKLKTGATLRAGSVAQIEFNPERNSSAKVTIDGQTYNLGVKNFNKYFGSPFMKVPSLATLEKYSDDGIAKTVTGQKTEPDGHGQDGSPSWLLVIGVI
jgi:hypothetical protein